MNLERILITSILCMTLLTTYAQTSKEPGARNNTDSLKAAALSEYAIKYPQIRQGFYAIDFIGKGYVKGELQGKDLYEGDMSTTRTRSNFRVPLTKWGRNTISGTISYQRVKFDMTDVQSHDARYQLVDRSITKSTVGFTASIAGTDSIFSRPFNYTGSISGITDEFASIKRLNYLGTITTPIKRTPFTSLTVGMVVILDPSAVSPVIPIISYWHKYEGSDLELFVDLPSRIALRKQLTKRSWTSIGSDLGGSLFFFDLNEPMLPQSTAFASVDLRSGATFEYLLTKKLIVGVNGGIYNSFSPRMFKRDEKPTDYFYKSKNAAVPFVSFSISFLPFLKAL